MKAFVKQMFNFANTYKIFPITLTKAVYDASTNERLDAIIKEQDNRITALEATVKELSSKIS